jgi:hypothetical protein
MTTNETTAYLVLCSTTQQAVPPMISGVQKDPVTKTHTFAYVTNDYEQAKTDKAMLKVYRWAKGQPSHEQPTLIWDKEIQRTE